MRETGLCQVATTGNKEGFLYSCEFIFQFENIELCVIRFVGFPDSQFILFDRFYEESSLVVKSLVIEIVRVYRF